MLIPVNRWLPAVKKEYLKLIVMSCKEMKWHILIEGIPHNFHSRSAVNSDKIEGLPNFFDQALCSDYV